MPKHNVLGIDVSKDWLDLDSRSTGAWRARNNDQGFKAILRVDRHKIALVVLEATGGHERDVTRALVKSNVSVSVVNPRQARDFAKSLGLIAKTDALDAEILRKYGELIPLKPYSPPPVHLEQLKELINERLHFMRLIGHEKQRLHSLLPAAKRTALAVIKSLQGHLVKLEKQIEEAAIKNENVTTNCELITSIKGISFTTAITLQTLLPELGHATGKEVASLAGLAPFNRDSGKRRGNRITWGGREHVRRVLWMCAVSAAHCNSRIRPFYDRLIDAGKPKKVALTACMRKLLIYCNAIVRDGGLRTT